VTEYIFGDIIYVGAGSHINPTHTPSVIVRRIDESYMLPDDRVVAEELAQDIMEDNNYNGWLCVANYTGRVIFIGKEGEKREIKRPSRR